jgi:exodeoxyribonuclease V alpha subunit
MIRGIGPVYAKKLVRVFGDKVFDVIEAQPDRLLEVDGIGPVRAGRITVARAEQKVVREIMVFLHSHGVGTARAVRIFKTYGADAVQVMSQNPYRLARDIRGIGFKTADAIAMKLGIEKSAMIRIRAGISYALTEAMNEGHCGLPTVLVRRKCISLVPADFGRTDTARFAVEAAEACHRADTRTELLRNFRDCAARPHHAYPQILRIGLPHPILAPSPARILNPIRVRMGIPLDSIFSGNALERTSRQAAGSSHWSCERPFKRDILE